MEKSAERFRKNIAGLLVLFLSAGLSLWAKPLSWAYLWGMRFRPSQDTLFTENDNSFFVEIENVTPDSVQISVNSLPPNVSFVSSKKETVLIPRSEAQGGGYSTGTRIILWMRFAKTGYYRIKPVDLTIDGGFYQIPFESVEVLQNPRFIHPEVSVVFQNQRFESAKSGKFKKPIKINAGDHVVFTVTARYMESIHNIFWNIPQNSIFKKIKEYEFSFPSGKSKFVTQFQSVATFDWQPLNEGEIELPEVFITATSYNGSVEDIACPRYKFNAEKAVTLIGEREEENPFVYAFSEAEVHEQAEEKIEVRMQDITELVNLHNRERHSFPFSKVMEERKAAELAIGLSCDYYEPSILVFRLLLCITIAAFCASLAMLFFRKKTLSAIIISMFILLSVCTGIYGVRVKTLRGVFTGGDMSPIPEHNMMSSVTIQAGSVVTVIRNAGNWMYIRHNDTYGWIPSNSICIIE